MKRLFAGVVTASAVSLGLAFAADDPMASYYGKTLVVKDANGSETSVWYSADNTYHSAMGAQTAKGTWSIKDNKFCVTQTDPVPAAAPGAAPAAGSAGNMAAGPACFPVPEAHQVGDTWTVTNPDGSKAALTLKAGS